MGQGNHKMERLERATKTGVLSLENIKLKSIPPEVKSKVDPARLRTLSVAGNTIEVLPDWLPTFTALKTLDLERNHISNLPDLSPLMKLETLNLKHNRLTTVPRCVFNLKSLKTLSLSDNRLAGVPPEGFGQLKKLLVLDLSDNRIQALPVDCGSYGVEELNLNGNQLSEMSPALAAAPRLRVLRVERNQLEKKSFPPTLLQDSTVNLILFEGNPVSTKQFQAIEGYDEYEKRYTASKKKMMH
eukprot:m.103705 g.103705  ORF g.103705 m.103705 type:complete len:243 (-) comp12586_c0_seq1:7151-7879(-)